MPWTPLGQALGMRELADPRKLPGMPLKVALVLRGRVDRAFWFLAGTARPVLCVRGPGLGERWGLLAPSPPRLLACWAEGPRAPGASYHQTEARSCQVDGRRTGLHFNCCVKTKELPFFWNFLLECGVLSVLQALLLLLLSCFSCIRLCVTHRRHPTRLPHPWDSPGKNTGVSFIPAHESEKGK